MRSAEAWRRVALAMTMAAGLTTVWAATSPTSVHADENQLILPGGGTEVTLGANSVLRVDGRLRYVNWCDQMPAPYRNTAINDFVYPATDIYIVEGNPAEAEGVLFAKLEDVAGSPSTVVQGGTAFIEHLIAITGPTGALEEGTYSIVFDTCQDGYFQRAYGDEVWPDAITVVYPPEIPEVDDSIAALKSNAHTEWGTWNQVGKTFDTLLNVEKLAGCGTKGVSLSALDNCLSIIEIWVDSPTVQAWIQAYGDVRQAAECGSGNPGACFGILSQYWGPKMQSPRDIVAGGAKNLIANQAKSFFGMYADPPRSDFTTPTSATITEIPVPVLNGDSPMFDALSLFASALEREQILNTALLAAVERYQGAEAAGDPVAAVAQARSAAGIAAALADARPITVGLLAALAATVHAEVPGLDDLNQAALNDLNRFRSNGPGADEARTLRNYGMSTPDLVAYVNDLRNPQRIGLHGWPLAGLNVLVTNLEAAEDDRTADLTAAAADLLALAGSITGPGVEAVPTITIAPVAPVGVGDMVGFTASASPGATITWDLDADGDFGDGAGESVTATFHVPGHRVIAARATNGDGVAVTAHALVEVDPTNAPPAITTATPTEQLLAGAVGEPATFTVTADDPDDDTTDLSYQWYVDGSAIEGATGSSVTITPTPADRGARTVSVTVNDTQPGNLAHHAWRWQVSDVDLDGDGWAANPWADCDDTNPHRSPGLIEQLYNGIDDDCSDATPDEPLELAVGQLWGWGTGDGAIGTGSNTSSATPRYQGFENVDQVAARFLGGGLLDDTGCVWGWGGQSIWGRIGDGDGTVSHTAPTPVPVVAPGTGIGGSQLCGVTQIDGSNNWIGAVTTGGRVLTWGSSGNGAIGQGIPHAAQSSYPVPGYVVTADLIDADEDGNLDPGTPLDGVVSVEASYGTGFALLQDGTVWRWGSGRCGESITSVFHAVPMPALDKQGTTIVQIEGGNQSVLARHSDGTVSYCLGSGALGAPQRLTLDTFAGQRAVDLAVLPSTTGALVLTEDGSLWVTGQPTTIHIRALSTEEPVTTSTWTRVNLPGSAEVIDLDGSDVPCAILIRRADGSAWSWGDTNRDCHGQGTATVLDGTVALPGPLAIAGEVRQVADGGYSGLAVVGREGADVWTWGTGGVLGRPTTGADYHDPAPVPGLSNVVELVATGDPGAHWALKADGSVVGWSPTAFAYFTAPSNNSVQPVKGIGGAGALTGVTHLVSGVGTVAALMSDGRVVTWGFGRKALGGGPDAPTNRLYPDYVLGPDLQPITDVVALWAGADGYVAQQVDGTILQWGQRECAGLHWANDPAAESDVALPPGNWPSDVVQWESAGWIGLARLADGSVLSCGEVSGQFGLLPVPGFGPDNPAVDVAGAAGPAWWVVTASGEVWVRSNWSAVYEPLGIPGHTWTRLELPEGAFAVGVTANAASTQVRLADGSLITFGTSFHYQTGRGPSDEPGNGNDWRLLPAWVDGVVLDSVVVGWNAAALVIPGPLVERTGWVPPQAAVAVSAVGATGPEGGAATAGIELSQPAATDLTVTWEFDDLAGTVQVPAGETSADVSLAMPEPDGIWGVERELTLVLTGVDAGAVLADAGAVVTVIDTDPPPVLTLAPASLPEGDEPLVGHTVTVTVTGSVPGIDVPLALTSTGVTAVAGMDFKSVSLDLVIPAGAVSITAPLVVFGNLVPQPSRALTLTAVPDHDDLAVATRSVTIVDDDPLALTATSQRVRAGAPARVQLRVPRVPAGESVQVAWATVAGSAQPGVDYTAGSGKVTVTGNAQGVGTGTITVATRDSGGGEAALSLLVTLAPTGTSRDVLATEQVVVSIDRFAATTPTTPPVPTVPTVPTPPDAPFPPSRYVPLAPVRLFDTRPNHPGAGPKGLVGPNDSIDITVTGRHGIPTDAVAVVLNVTVTETTAASHVTVYPTGTQRPLASSINNIQPGQTRPNLVTVPIGDSGKITLYSLQPAHLLADIAGYYLATDTAVRAGRFIPLTPQRIFDTRPDTPAPGHEGRLAPGETIRVQVTGVGDVPTTGVAAIVINLTGADATAAGFITAYPTSRQLPLASNVNLSGPGDTAPNLAIVPLGPDGAINIHSSHGTHALGDVTGYITNSSAPSSTTGLFVPLHPTRVFDTRPDETPPGPKGYVPADGTIDISTAGTAGIPSDATGVVLNIVGIQSPIGHLTIWPTGRRQPLASTLNFSTPPLDTRANAAMLPVGRNGRVAIYTLNGGHILADTTGYYL